MVLGDLQALTRIGDVIAVSPRYVVIRIGVNSIAAGATGADTFVTVEQMCETLIRAGSEPILVLDTGGGDLPEGNGIQLNDYNARLQAYAAARGLKVFDPRPGLLASPPGTWPFVFRPGYTEDELHPNLRGAFAEGVAFWAFLSPLIGAAPSRAATGRVLMSNAAFSDGDGGVAEVGATGTLPADFTGIARGGEGATATFSINTLADGSREVVMVATATAAASAEDPQGIGLEQIFADAQLRVGDVFEGGADIVIDPGATGLIGVTSFVRYAAGDQLFITYDMFPDLGSPFGAIECGITYTTRAPPLRVAETPTEASWYTRAYFNGPGRATIRIRRPWAALRRS